jgi:hypothetical protein
MRNPGKRTGKKKESTRTKANRNTGIKKAGLASQVNINSLMFFVLYLPA